MRVELQPAYVLHSRHYRDSSLLVELLTPNYGRVSAVVKGVRSTTKHAKQRRSLIQPFIPLLISWSGQSGLKTIIHNESCGAAVSLHGQRLFSALYVNELLTRLLPHYDGNPATFQLYQHTISALAGDTPMDIVLRQFEIQLLEELGYGIDFTAQANSSEPLREDCDYRFEADCGFVVEYGAVTDRSAIFCGEDLLALANGDYNDSARKAAKRLCRLALAAHLGSKPLKSRELFA